MTPIWLQYAAVVFGLLLWCYLCISLLMCCAIGRSKRRQAQSVARQIEQRGNVPHSAGLRPHLGRILRRA